MNKIMTKLCSVCEISKPENAWTSETFVDEKSTICKKCSNKKKASEKKEKMTKLCSVCEISKSENGWTSKTFADEKSTICKKCSKKKSSVSNKLWRAGPKDMVRKIIHERDLPLTVPFSQLQNEKSMELSHEVLERGEGILVTLFRDQVEQTIEQELLKGVKGMMGKITLQFAVTVSNKFPGCQVRLLEWPEIFRSGNDTKRSTHPYISYRCRAAVIVSKEGDEIIDKQPFIDSLFKAVHDEALDNSKNKWVLVGDETGTLREFESNSQTGPISTMCWIAIPPGTNLPALDPEHHCSGFVGTNDYIQAIRNLSEHEEILYFTFSFEQGDIPNMNEIGRDPHLSFWKETLPLVLEKIASITNKKTKVDIFVEQVGGLESGIGVIQPIVSTLATKFQNRDGWNKLYFDQLWVISKGEHPWIGYPDALGHNINKTKLGKAHASLMENYLGVDKAIYNGICKSPFRQSSLNGPIMQALNDTSRRLVFLQSLHSIEANDLRDYITPFLGDAIAESISSLDENDWQDLLIHIDVQSRDKKGQRATALICNHIKIDEVLKDLKEPSVKFDLLRMLLGTFNHRGAIKEAVDCKEKAEALLKLGFEPMSEKKLKFDNIARGLKLNMFDFSGIDATKDFEYNSELTKERIQELGTNSQSFGLTGDPINRKNAMTIERILHVHGDDRRHKRRHSILLAELLMDDGSYIEAEEVLNKQYLDGQDSFFFAAQLKNRTLLEKNHSIFKSMNSDFTELLDDYHPSQRITYWCARWAMQVGENESELVVKCIKHLISLTEIPHFSSDAPGVILSCELMDLESRGYKINIDTMQFYELVKNNSQPSTIEWLKKHPPSEDDWLAPLNFNYR